MFHISVRPIAHRRITWLQTASLAVVLVVASDKATFSQQDESEVWPSGAAAPVAGRPPDEEEKRQVLTAGVLLVAGILMVGVILIALVMVWGARMRRVVRTKSEPIPPPDPLWYLKPKPGTRTGGPPSEGPSDRQDDS
jgi:hypothetical protein